MANSKAGPDSCQVEGTRSASNPIASLSTTEKQFLLQLARLTLTDFLQTGRLPEISTASTALLSPRAVFITLRRRDSGELRGCRGESQARRPLIEAVPLMTVAAGTDDPRFEPVTADEVADLHIEINALTPIQPIKPSAIEVGRHGLLLTHQDRAGLLLPEVPLHYGWDRLTYLQALCRKARLPKDAWRDPDTKLFGFEAEVWAEALAP